MKDILSSEKQIMEMHIIVMNRKFYFAALSSELFGCPIDR
jgi:hypothetical protein